MTDDPTTEGQLPPIDPLWRQYIVDLDRQRRSGWARVAQLEQIIDVLNQALGRLSKVVVDYGQEIPDETWSDLSELLHRCDEADPPSRDRWPPR